MSPARARRPCPHPSCPELTTGGACPAHRRRRSAHRLGYTARWARRSKQIRKERPWCEDCGICRSTQVDHIDGDRDNWARSNLRALCISCHSKKGHRAGQLHPPQR